jgi:DNA-binding GntR family transcriptional regulator
LQKTVSTKKATRRKGAGRKQTDAPNLPPIASDETISIEKRVYASLRVAMMSGAVLPGASLTSRSLSVALGVSNTPVRDALKRLEADGALKSKNKSAFYVNDPSLADFESVLEIRLRLEGLAIRKAAERATPTDIARLTNLNEGYEAELVRPGHAGSALMQNFRFHFETYRISGSPILVDLIETTWLRIGPTLHRYVTQLDVPVRATVHHRDMIEALARRDGDAAESAVSGDLVAAFEAMRTELTGPRLRQAAPEVRAAP